MKPTTRKRRKTGKPPARPISPPKTLRHPLVAEATPELVIGLVGPLGVDLNIISDVLEKELASVQYTSIEIRLSHLLDQLTGLDARRFQKPEEKRIRSYMRAGTELRTRLKWGDALAMMAVASIREERAGITKNDNEPAPHTAYILRSLKHRSEVELMRAIYGDGFIAISVYAPKEERISSLSKIIGRETNDIKFAKYVSVAEELINIDEAEEGNKLGQNVGDAFPVSDFFIDARTREDIENGIRRFIEIFFGNEFHTPTRDEFGMYQATATALRSADLSRQVGAALMSGAGEIIALGCNDIPKAGGGLYWANDGTTDRRDFKLGFDSSVKSRTDILLETLDGLLKAGLLSPKVKASNLRSWVDELVTGDLKEQLRGSQIANLLEFGRPVHAEMAAITDAAKRGVSTEGSTLYCTTFPCHLCARLIIAAGMSRVVFVEPYPKSKTKELYADSVTVDEVEPNQKLVNFESFVGLSPKRYDRLFRMSKRKDAMGNALPWDHSKARPRFQRFVPSYTTLEQMVVTSLPHKLREAGLALRK